MTDDDLDRRLREALRVAPSPDLAARVRARIANEPAPAWRWLPALIGGLGVAAMIAILVARSAPSSVTAPPGRAEPVTTADAATGERPTVEAPMPPPGHSVRVARDPGRLSPASVSAATSSPSAESAPELLLAPGDAEAFRVLLTFSRGTTGADGPTEPIDRVNPLQLSPIEIAPLEIAPLALADDVPEGDPR